MLNAEIKIDVMVVEDKLVNWVNLIMGSLLYSVQTKDLSNNLTFISICGSLSQVFSLILVESSIQEEIGNFNRLGRFPRFFGLLGMNRFVGVGFLFRHLFFGSYFYF